MTVDGVYLDIADEVYHADRHSLSSSGARLLLPPSCPALFRDHMDTVQKPKRAYDFGHVAHRLVLGKGAEFSVLDPAVHGLKKDGTVADSPRATAGWKFAEEEARAFDRVPIHVDDFDKAEAMAAAVREHPVAGPLFIDGQPEVSLYAEDPGGSGVQLRARADWMTGEDYDPRLWIVDYKTSTTCNPDVFSRKAADFGYHVQAAFYRMVVIALGISADPAFVFVVQEKDPPYLVSVVEWDRDAMREGERLARQAINLYGQCVAADDWPTYPGTDVVVPISLPPWAFTPQPTISDLLSTEEIDEEEYMPL